MSKVSFIHNYIINKTCEVIKNERCIKNEKVLNENLSFNKIYKDLNSKKIGHNIYILTGDNAYYYFIGDLHSDATSIKRILKISDFFKAIIENKDIRLVFLGDYVDRGEGHLKTIELILLLKYIFPKNIFLLKGNHDGGKLVDGNMEMIVGRNKGSLDRDYFVLYTYNLAKENNTFDMETVKNYLRFFDSLPTVALINNKINILAVHGGIPRPKKGGTGYYNHIKSLSDITNKEITDHIDRSVVHNMLWSDPCDDDNIPNRKTGRFRFYRRHFINFIKILGIDIIVRGHEAEEEGYKKFFNNKLYTIFSSGMILDDDNHNINDETAYEKIKPKVMKLNGGEISIIDINSNN
ncbi:metallophosphoesterase family protein [Dethiothermospora halolimnae]|uniref:metallophosphoesterase family protein n=1 Tax=Dethiothermospora halolimnae TaxID=3114390 RepID=UPI003CCC096D